jgi:hypothetical protein
MNVNLIPCGDHQYAPWCAICVHLAEGTSNQWVAIPNEQGNPDVLHDWVCPACAERLPDLDAQDFKAVCIHCVRALQAEAGH